MTTAAEALVLWTLSGVGALVAALAHRTGDALNERIGAGLCIIASLGFLALCVWG
jgi:hypothetical protein